jgi:hypothetical protein
MFTATGTDIANFSEVFSLFGDCEHCLLSYVPTLQRNPSISTHGVTSIMLKTFRHNYGEISFTCTMLIGLFALKHIVL